ncbi:MAG: alpha/beta fold hydrolase [Deltaproteobacteria bacterium]|nr:alpha/beta fold hydrolase [Deltaproteobacteria bacterium]
MRPHLAYLHGFASSPDSIKGTRLAAVLEGLGQDLHRPDLTRPDFAHLTLSAALEALDRMDAAHGGGARWALIGSSLGGYLAARWAELHPDRVERLVLLCPAFEMNAWWPRVVGAQGMTSWRAHGRLALPDAHGVPTPVHWGFIEDAMTHPAFPEVPCPTLIIHGTADATIPVETSMTYAASRDRVRLVTLEDDHALTASLATIIDLVVAELGLGPAPPAAP